MAPGDVDEQYFVYEARFASFHGPQPVAAKRRASTASSRAPKALSWPHKTPGAVALAKAGFFFNPRPSNPDNVQCFLCHKELDGWEPDDDPLAEHLKHSSTCGWACCAAIEAELGDSAKEDPRQPHLLEARKATFADRWPYETKKGWKCKTKQLAEAGWKYTPTLDSDDHTTCTYCQLALDGWEPSDKPLDEHQRRSPDCPFFALTSGIPAPKKAGRVKAARGSKASRASTLSTATAESDGRSVSDLPAENEDSILTTSVMTQGSKKGARGKKAAPAKGRKTRAKKDDVVEIHEDADAPEVDVPALAPSKSAHGKKRSSDAMEDSVLTNAEAPALKKRATRARASNGLDTSRLTISSQHDVDMELPPVAAKAPAGRKKGRTASATKRTRKGSAASIASTASTASLRSKMPDDEEIDRQLEADLKRPLAKDDVILSGSGRAEDNEHLTSCGISEPTRHVNKDFAMFDPAPAEPDEAAVDAELEALQVEMEVYEPIQEIQVPKKGRKAGPRKASKQTKKAADVAPVEPDSVPSPAYSVQQPAPEVDVVGEHDISSATVVRGPSPAPAPPKRGRGRPKKSNDSQIANDLLVTIKEPAAEVLSVAIKQPAPMPQANALLVEIDDDVEEATAICHSFSGSKSPAARVVLQSPVAADPKAETPRALPVPHRAVLALPPSTPRTNHISPAPSARQPVLSPSPSPQASDAENQPPSSKPTASAKRPALAAIATPMRGNRSPSKHTNVIGGLRSDVPWMAVDLELVFEKENIDELLESEDLGLTSEEKVMTVEEWIYHNAGKAEGRLKAECEAMVTAFEREGTRGLRVLEALVVDED